VELRQAFATALKTLRRKKGFTQEDFSVISSRTYLSTLERGMKSPTLDKIDALAKRMNLHPLTLLMSCYCIQEKTTPKEIFSLVYDQLDHLESELDSAE
jgi:transcriptional regulator with XRE-family HTH domain